MHNKLQGIQSTCLEISKGCSHMSSFRFPETIELFIVCNIKFLSD